MPFEFKRIREGDLPEVKEQLSEHSRVSFERGETFPQEDELLCAARKGLLLAAFAGDELAGFTAAKLDEKNPRSGWYDYGWVHPKYRKAGLGSELFKAGSEWLFGKGVERVRLLDETPSGNGLARAFGLKRVEDTPAGSVFELEKKNWERFKRAALSSR